MAEGVITFGVPLALGLLVVGIYQHYRLLRTLGMSREGILAFLQSLTLKAWVAALIIYVLTNTSVGPFPQEVRQRIVAIFVALLVVQAAFSVVTSRRWRESREA